MSDPHGIVESDYTDTLKGSYINYSMSVITDRAVPDVRDGLKPVQRRILYAMYKMGCGHDRPYKKSARISGDVIGKYHPHGNAGVEDAMVVMAQTFKRPIALIDGQGNFGSIEGDGAAAARYTEARLTGFSEDCYLKLLDSNVVQMHPNYDETLEEPDVLPSILPMVLLTGAEGIAVGMRTCIPTYNLAEVIDANIYLLEHPDCRDRILMRRIPGPDFISGGVICNGSDLPEIQSSGEGRMRIRGKVEYDPRTRELAITEVPCTVIGKSITTLMGEIAALAESKEITGVRDIVDETSKDVRIVLKLSKSADPDSITRTLFERTRLEDTLGVNMLVIADGVPVTMGIPGILRSYVEFQKGIFRRKYEHDLEGLQARREVLDGYAVCVENIDGVLEIIRGSASVASVRETLMDEYGFTDAQCDAILKMRISGLVGMDSNSIRGMLADVDAVIESCTTVLSDDSRLSKAIVDELKHMKKKYGRGRRTLITDIA